MSKSLPRRLAIQALPKTPEQPDPSPVHIPGRSQAPLTLRDEMRRYIREQISNQAADTGDETYEESNDFETEDAEQDLLSPYTVVDLLPEDQAIANDLDGSPTPQDEAEPLNITPAEPPLTAEPSDNAAPSPPLEKSTQ